MDQVEKVNNSNIRANTYNWFTDLYSNSISRFLDWRFVGFDAMEVIFCDTLGGGWWNGDCKDKVKFWPLPRLEGTIGVILFWNDDWGAGSDCVIDCWCGDGDGGGNRCNDVVIACGIARVLNWDWLRWWSYDIIELQVIILTILTK